MRIVYDTSVLATLTRREELIIFKSLVSTRQIISVTSLYILEELERVLVEKFSFTKQKARITVRLFVKLSVVVSPRKIEKICRDPYDDYILATAVKGQAEYIITSDKDLLVLNEHKGVRIMRMAELKGIISS